MSPKSFLLGLLGVAAGLGGGILLEREMLSPGPPSAQVQNGPRILYWWDPMIPDYKSDMPGKSPMGMDMVPVYEGQEPGGTPEAGVVTVASAAMNNLGVRTAAVERANLVPTVETFGTVAFDGNRTSHLHVRAEGWVERIQTRVVGEPVERGQVLFEFFSKELITAAYEYVREIQRGSGNVADLARRKLTALGVADRQIEEIRKSQAVPERIKVYAPQAGIVSAIGVAEGMFVQPDMTLMTITDLDTVWVIAEVFESQAALVRPGAVAEVRVAGLPGRTWSGKIDYVYPDLRPDTRTVRLRIRIDNRDRALKPNMFASVTLATEPRENVLAIPSEALIRTGNAERVVLAVGDGRFKPVPVEAGMTVGGNVEIREGLREGDRVVTSAHFLIDSESSLSAGFARMQEAEPTAPQATGIEGEVQAVTEDSTLTIRHGPIPALGWPAMTMDFALKAGSARPAPGDRIRFDVAQAPDGSYTAANVARLSAPPSGSAADGAKPPPVEAWTTAVVNGASAADRTVNLSHEPIPAIGWPAMTMDFPVDGAIPLDGLKTGSKVRVGLSKGGDGAYRVIAVEPVGGTS